MANKQTIPNTLLSVNVGDISSPAPNRVVAPEWKEQKFKIASNLAKGVVGISASYKDMKHTEMLAKLDNVQQQNLHALGDATDPCQLPELVKQANESYDTMFKDDYYGKSFYESEAYKKFKQSNELKVQQKVQEMNHKFAGIQAVATGNEISSDIALMTDTNRMSGALRTYEAMLSQMELTADEKFRIMSEVTKSAFGKVLANNPNNAVAWYNASQGAYDKYGVNGADLMDKADRWNKAQRAEQLTLENKLRTAKKNEEDAQIASLTQQARLGTKSKSEIQLEADGISARVGNEVYKALNTGNDNKAEIRKHNQAMSELIDVNDYQGSQDSITKYLLDNPDAPSESRAFINDILGDIKPDKESQKFTFDQISTINQVKNGLQTLNDEEMRYVANGNSDVYKALLDARDTYIENLGKLLKETKAEIKAEKSELKAIEKEAKAEFKEAQKAEQDKFNSNSKIALGNYETEAFVNKNNPRKLAEMVSTYHQDLTPEDNLSLKRKVLGYVSEFDENSKKEYNNELKKEQVRLTQNILNQIDNGTVPSDGNMEQLAYSVTEEQLNRIRTARSSKLKEIGTGNIKQRNNSIIANTYRIWDEGKTVDVDEVVSQMMDLSADEEAKWRNSLFEGNKRVATLVENQNLAKIQDAIWKSPTLPSDDTLREMAREVSKNGITDEATLFDSLVQMRDEKAKDVNGKKTSVIEQLNTYWVAEGAYADTQKNKAIRAVKEIIDNGKEPDVAKIITEYMPTPSQIRNSVLNESSATYEIENLQSKLFGYATTKIEDGDSQIKYSEWVANEDINFNDFRNYELLVENAMEKELITSDKYSEYVKPLMSGYEKAVNNALENPNSIIGRAATLLRNALYPATDELTLFDTEIKDYQDFYHHLSKIADLLEFYNVPLDATITKGERVLNSIKMLMGKEREYRGDFITTEVVVDEYVKSLFPNAKSGNKIVK